MPLDSPFDGTPHETNWEEVTRFFNGVISEAEGFEGYDKTHGVRVSVYSPALGQTLEVSVPARSVEDLMKNLPLFEAQLYSGGPN